MRAHRLIISLSLSFQWFHIMSLKSESYLCTRGANFSIWMQYITFLYFLFLNVDISWVSETQQDKLLRFFNTVWYCSNITTTVLLLLLVWASWLHCMNCKLSAHQSAVCTACAMVSFCKLVKAFAQYRTSTQGARPFSVVSRTNTLGVWLYIWLIYFNQIDSCSIPARITTIQCPRHFQL